MKVASQLCEDRLARDIFDLFTDNFSDNKILSTINNLAPKFEDIMEFCRFADESPSCHTLLYPIITEEGMCYTFNGLSINEIVTDQ